MLTLTRLHRDLPFSGISRLPVYRHHDYSERLCGFRVFSSLAQEEPKSKKVIPYMLADIGEGIAEVELLQWYVTPGDHVAQFDRICEVQSDKATVEITSRYDGVIESLDGQVGDMISVGTPLLHIAVSSKGDETTTQLEMSPTLNNVDDEEDRLHIPSLASKFDLDQEQVVPASKTSKVLTTPAVRKLAMDYDLDLGNVVGTGPKGRVLKADVLKMLKDSGIFDEGTSDTQQPKSAPSLKEEVVEDKTVEIKGFNRLMVKSMTASLQIPHMCYADEIVMNEILKCRKELKPLAESYGIKLSLLPFAIKAASLAMKEYPVLNSTLNAEEYKVTYRASHNIGVAMDTPRGLAVPVVKECQNLSVLEIAQELQRLKNLVRAVISLFAYAYQCVSQRPCLNKAVEGALSENDITNGTFTLSNVGAIGGTYMSPIVTSPQVAIGAMGRVQRVPRFVGDKVEEVHIMQISWGGDHRVIDGATMARFSNQWKAYMESPMSMVFSMK
jgi:2-oxoisovalerate dehydrogenase E2 component (dihydrolipoyl transacylase)